MRFYWLKNYLKNILGIVPYEKARFFISHGYPLKLSQPTTLNEKICQRKIFNRDIKFVKIANKYSVREYIAPLIGSEYLTECFFHVENVYPKISDLPDSFAMKATHGSGREFIRFVNNKKNLTNKQFIKLISKFQKFKYGNVTNEWWYEKMEPSVIIEEYLHDDTFGIPLDYKFFVFHGKVEFIQVDYSRYQHHSRSLYNAKWQPLDCKYKYTKGILIPPPKNYQLMIEIAEKIGCDFDFIRVDQFNINNSRIVVGELTIAPEAGWGKITPRKWDYYWGNLW